MTSLAFFLVRWDPIYEVRPVRFVEEPLLYGKSQP